jgi:hypothetical protein
MLHSPFAAAFLLPSLSVSMQHVDFGLAKGGHVPYLVLSKPHKASPFTPYASSYPTWIIKLIHNIGGHVAIRSYESGSEDDP